MIKHNEHLLVYFDQLMKASPSGSQIQQRSFAKGQVLLSQDEPPQYLYLLRRGVAKCFLTEEHGRRYVFEFFGPGEIVGELEQLTGSSNLCTVSALTAMETYQFTPDFFMSDLLGNPTFTRLLLNELALRLTRTSRRASYQQLFPLEYAMLKVLYGFAQVDQPLTKEDLADYLAVSLRSLNRILSNLYAQGVVRRLSHSQIAADQQAVARLIEQYH